MTDAEATPVDRSETSRIKAASTGDDRSAPVPTRRPRWVRNLAIGLGVPLVVAAIFVALVVTDVIRDGQRADYCAVYADTSAPLVPLYSELEEALAAGDAVTILFVVLAVRENIDPLDETPATPRIDARLRSMNDYLRRVELAARARDQVALDDLAFNIGLFRANRQGFLVESSEYCRYR
jgi:hypothetical protein